MFRYCFVLLFALVLGILSCSSAISQMAAIPAQTQSASATQTNLAAQWLQQTIAHLSPQQAQLNRQAQATLLGNIVSASAWKPYRGVEPSRGSYPGIWNWDSAFHAIALSHWDPGLAREQFDILFSHQLPNGELPDVIYANGTMVTSNTKPPVMAWAIAVVDRRSPNTEFLRDIYPKLMRLGDFWLNNRGGATDGLFYYAGSDIGYDSGWDNSIRWDDGYRKARSNNHRLWAIDLNCYMVMHYRAMAYIAGGWVCRGTEPGGRRRPINWLTGSTRSSGTASSDSMWIGTARPEETAPRSHPLDSCPCLLESPRLSGLPGSPQWPQIRTSSFPACPLQLTIHRALRATATGGDPRG